MKVHKGTKAGLKALQGSLFPEECEPRKRKGTRDPFYAGTISLCRLHPPVTALSRAEGPECGFGFLSGKRHFCILEKNQRTFFLNFLFVCVSFFLILFLRVPFSSVIVTSGRS